MTDLIPRDAAIAAITIGHTVTQHEKALRAIPTIDPAAIREALLTGRSYVEEWVKNDGGIDVCDIQFRTDLEQINAAILALIGEKK